MSDENTAEYWEKVREIYERVLGVVADQREAALKAACEGDVDLQSRVECLLRAFENNPDFLETPLDLPSPSQSYEPRQQQLGAYRLLRRLGSGGMGLVYLAERDDGHFQRRVAIKIASPESTVPDLPEKFFRERQILADLDHPNISRLFDGGVTEEGLPYLVMEYVDGERVTDYCHRRDLSVEQRVRLFLEVCLAVEYAHGQGIIHRDIKPGNVLVRTDGKVKLLDFGIARILGRDGQMVSGAVQFTGTPLLSFDYASPEQVRGERVGHASDIYSLGVLLFCMIEGRLPYDLPNRAPLLLAEAITIGPSRPLEKAGGSWITRQLTSLLERALAKNPEDRYPSVAALRQDLTEILAGRPIRRARLSRQLPRHARPVILVLAAVGLGVVSAIVWSLSSRAAYDSPLTRYAGRIAEAHRALRKGDHPRAQAILASLKTDPTLAPHLGFEWGYLMNQAEEPRVFPHSDPVDQSYIPDQSAFLVTTSADFSAVHLWDLSSGALIRSRQEPGQKLWSKTYPVPDLPLQLVDFNGSLTIEDGASGRQLARCPLPAGEVIGAHYFRGEFYTVEKQGNVRQWDLPTCQSSILMTIDRLPQGTLRSYHNRPFLAEVSPKSFSLWSLVTRRLLVHLPPQPTRLIEGLQFDEASTRMAFFRFPSEVEVRDLRPGGRQLRYQEPDKVFKILLDSRADRVITLHHLGKVKVRSLSRPDSLQTVDLQAPIWGGELLGEERLVAVTTETGRLEIFDLETLRTVVQRQAHPPGVRVALRYDLPGRRLITSGGDGTARVWSLDRLLRNAPLRPFPKAEVSSVAVSPNGQRLAVGDHDHLVHLWNLETRRLERTIPAHSAWVHDLSLSPDGQRLATASREHAVKIWQVSTGELLRSLPHDLQVLVVGYSPSGQSLATSSSDKAVRLWDPETGQLQRKMTGFLEEVRALAWSPSDPLLATGTLNGEVRFWDLGPDGEGFRLSQTPAKVTSLAFSPDGKSLVVVGNDSKVRFYDVARRRLRTTFSGPSAGGRLVTFSPDGKRLAFAGEDRAVRIFDASSGRELLRLDEYSAPITSLRFSPDGQALYTGVADHRVQAYSTIR
jgi:serine/threonine protein kinase/WD40 repeat protein